MSFKYDERVRVTKGVLSGCEGLVVGVGCDRGGAYAKVDLDKLGMVDVYLGALQGISPQVHCGRCHACGTKLKKVLDGEEWCPTCGAYRRYPSHGWRRETGPVACPSPPMIACALCGIRVLDAERHEHDCVDDLRATILYLLGKLKGCADQSIIRG